MPKALAILSPEGNAAFLASHTSAAAPAAAVSWNMPGVLLFQTSNQVCDPSKAFCAMEMTRIMILLISLCATVVLVICTFAFFRDDREEQITPLCPQLVVKDSELVMRFPMDSQDEHMDVVDDKSRENIICNISEDWPDLFHVSPNGVAATVRVHSRGMTLATVVARNVAVLGQGLALCRSGTEIFGFVEPDGDRFLVRHKSGVHLLTLMGNFKTWEIDAVNPVGAKVCILKKHDGDCVGKLVQHVDAGLVLCALMAIRVHQKLVTRATPTWPTAPSFPLLATPMEFSVANGGTQQISSEVAPAPDLTGQDAEPMQPHAAPPRSPSLEFRRSLNDQPLTQRPPASSQSPAASPLQPPL